MEPVEENITLRLQRDDTDMAEVRFMFDALITEYPAMGEHLKQLAKNVHTPGGGEGYHWAGSFFAGNSISKTL
ncbi:hypothetical protein PHMEG_00011038 [Phytophthora megakarya]|uniref:Uncharacterized protein n=1 Tax=Phytophthora megakarya TaxID=4795 RepID=A0A225WDX0_9STRA|nr:hypothetical protein PHMEG_00011038 [Phytophthora megakarya]